MIRNFQNVLMYNFGVDFFKAKRNVYSINSLTHWFFLSVTHTFTHFFPTNSLFKRVVFLWLNFCLSFITIHPMIFCLYSVYVFYINQRMILGYDRRLIKQTVVEKRWYLPVLCNLFLFHCVEKGGWYPTIVHYLCYKCQNCVLHSFIIVAVSFGNQMKQIYEDKPSNHRYQNPQYKYNKTMNYAEVVKNPKANPSKYWNLWKYCHLFNSNHCFCHSIYFNSIVVSHSVCVMFPSFDDSLRFG